MAGVVHLVDADEWGVIRDVVAVPQTVFEGLFEVEITVLKEAVQIILQDVSDFGEGELELEGDAVRLDVANVDRVEAGELIL